MNLVEASKKLDIWHSVVGKICSQLKIDTKNITAAQYKTVERYLTLSRSKGTVYKTYEAASKAQAKGFKRRSAEIKANNARAVATVRDVPSVRSVSSVKLVVEIREGVRIEAPISREQAKLVLQ